MQVLQEQKPATKKSELIEKPLCIFIMFINSLNI